MPTYALSTTIKNGLNVMLRPIGLEIASTLEKRVEDARLRKLRQREHWSEPRYNKGLALNDQKALQFLEETCRPYRSEYRSFPPTSNGDGTQYYLENEWFGSVDAEILYCVLRRFEPANVVEVGSGFSTRLMRRSINDGKLATRVTSIDPNPNTSVQPYADEYIKAPVEDVEAKRILNLLSAGDILFIDSSHVVKTGGDVPYLFLEILPRLSAGVFVHIHDIFLPFDYPEPWVRDDWGCTEQYLVHAFLAYNEAFEILWPARYMWERYRSRIEDIIPTTQRTKPSSLWLKIRE